MSRRQSSPAGLGVLELIEESVALLRRAPATALVAYYVGSLPFILGFLYFWADMSRAALAWQHCPQAALGLALLYLWMKSWQTVFAVSLHRQLVGEEPGRWTVSRISRMVAAQALLQSTSLVLLPVTAILTVPFGWAYAFYHNVTLFGNGREPDVRSVIRRAWRQATVWPSQNHSAALILWSFSLFVFLNVAIGLMMIPALLKMLAGIETAFSMSIWTMFNSTFLAVATGLTYLCVNPLIKALYVLRCFYGESRQTGADLKATLRSLAPAAALAVLLVLLAVPARGTAPEPPTDDPQLASQLDQSIDQVINKPEYTWRSPREQETVEKTAWDRFADSLRDWMNRTQRSISRFLQRLEDWLDKFFRHKTGHTEKTDHWEFSLHVLYAVVILGVIALLGLVIYRLWQQRRRRLVNAVAVPVAPAIDLAGDNVVADQLPPEGWLKTAHELMAAGELRLAMRAFYLATLAHLGQRELIRITKFKSNHEYENELARRARDQAPLRQAFAENLLTFENVWYGMHDITPDLLNQFSANFDRIRGTYAS